MLLALYVQGPSAPEASPVKVGLLQVLGPPVDPLVRPEEEPPLGLVDGSHPRPGDDPVRQEHLHVHVVVDQMVQPEGPEHRHVGPAVTGLQEKPAGLGLYSVLETGNFIIFFIPKASS